MNAFYTRNQLFCKCVPTLTVLLHNTYNCQEVFSGSPPQEVAHKHLMLFYLVGLHSLKSFENTCHLCAANHRAEQNKIKHLLYLSCYFSINK